LHGLCGRALGLNQQDADDGFFKHQAVVATIADGYALPRTQLTQKSALGLGLVIGRQDGQ
jgi:hypothetical protein